MAIQSNFISRYGVTFDTAYTVIGRLDYNKFAKSGPDTNAHDTTAEGWVFADSTARQNGAEPVAVVALSFDVDLESENNPVAQAYDVLKALMEFVGAVDV